jgi:hypothetical protein
VTNAGATTSTLTAIENLADQPERHLNACRDERERMREEEEEGCRQQKHTFQTDSDRQTGRQADRQTDRHNAHTHMIEAPGDVDHVWGAKKLVLSEPRPFCQLLREKRRERERERERERKREREKERDQQERAREISKSTTDEAGSNRFGEQEGRNEERKERKE